MILNQIVLTDFKCYEGINTLDFTPPSGNRNIYLIGGKNGAGKTSLVKAIAMALCGAEPAFKEKVLRHPGDPAASSAKRKEDVRDEIRSIINKSALQAGRPVAKVTIVMDGSEGHLEVTRSWRFDRAGDLVEEKLQMLLNGAPVKEDQDPETGELYTAEQVMASILDAIFPPDIARFFLFDGEDIQRLANEKLDDEMVKGVDLLLGFSVLKQLESDLKRTGEDYERLEEQSMENQIKALEHLRVVKQLEVDRTKSVRQRDELATLLDEHKDELGVLEEKLRPFFAEGKSSVAELNEEIERGYGRLKGLDHEILRCLESTIIPSLPSALSKQLLNRLDGEAKYEVWMEGKKKVEPKLNQLCKAVLGPEARKPVPPLLDTQQRFLEQLLREEWEQLFHPPPADVATDPRHDRLAREELDAVRAKLQEVLHSPSIDLETVLGEREMVSRRVRDLESRLNVAEENDELMGMVARRDDLNRRIGELQAQHDLAMRQIENIDDDLKEKKRQHTSVQQQADGEGPPASEKVRFCKDVQEIVRKFQERRRPQKLAEVRNSLIEMFRKLARKEDVIQDIEIDMNEHQIRLLDRRKKVVPMRELSAGEKEIFAISLLWALAQASGVELPVVIDTPLARLDRDHRQNIVRRYLPRASTQVVILSTDTELDTQYLQDIEDSIVDKHRLVFDANAERTGVERGYF